MSEGGFYQPPTGGYYDNQSAGYDMGGNDQQDPQQFPQEPWVNQKATASGTLVGNTRFCINNNNNNNKIEYF